MVVCMHLEVTYKYRYTNEKKADNSVGMQLCIQFYSHECPNLDSLTLSAEAIHYCLFCEGDGKGEVSENSLIKHLYLSTHIFISILNLFLFCQVLITVVLRVSIE